MSARWDDAVPARRREGWLGRAMTLLSLDATRALAADLGFEEGALVALQADLRRALDAPLAEMLAGASPSLPADRVLGALDPPAQAEVRSFYDRVARYVEGEPNALFFWGLVLTRCARDDARWDALGLPAASSAALRNAYRAAYRVEVPRRRAASALAGPLSAWDARVAALRLFPPPEDDVLEIDEGALSGPAAVVNKLGFWRTAADRLGEGGLAALHARANAFLATQADLTRACRRLHDPWLLAHPEIFLPDAPAG